MKRSNILDPVHDGLSALVFDQPDSTHPKLKAQHRTWIKRTIYAALAAAGYTDIDQWLHLVLTGSLCTYQYSDESDCDISLFVDTAVFPEWSRAEMIGVMVGKVDGTTLPGTPFPMQDFVVPPQVKPNDLYKPGLRSGYDLDLNSWIVPPERERVHDVEHEQNGFYVFAMQMADKMESLLRYEPDKAILLWHQIHKRRQRDQKAGKGDFAESNIVYKYLANRGLFKDISEASGEYIAKTASPATPEFWKEVPTLYHSTPNPEAVERMGIIPWDHPESPGTRYIPQEQDTDWHPLEPRPGHTYLQLWPNPIKSDHTVFAVDPTKLDPHLVNADEDWPMEHDQYVKNQMWTGDGSLGEQAEAYGLGNNPEHTQRSLDDHETVAYRGVIPPEALTRVSPDGHIKPWSLGRHLTNGASTPIIGDHGIQNVSSQTHQSELGETPQSDGQAQIEPSFPELPDAIEANKAALAGYGQTNHALLRPEVLESALGRAANQYYYTGSMTNAAAALAHGVGQAQAFEDGNKRTAYWLTHQFLHENGLGHLMPEDDPELADHLVGYGEGTHNMDMTAEMFRNRGGGKVAAGQTAMYHGTNYSDAERTGLTPAGEDPEYGAAVWLTPDLERAKDHGGFVYAVDVSGIPLEGPLGDYDAGDDGVYCSLAAIPSERIKRITSAKDTFTEWDFKDQRKASPRQIAKFVYDPTSNRLVLGEMGAEEGEKPSHYQLASANFPQEQFPNLMWGHVGENGYVQTYGRPKIAPGQGEMNQYQAQYRAEEALRRALPHARFTNPQEQLRPEWDLPGDPAVTYMGEPPAFLA